MHRAHIARRARPRRCYTLTQHPSGFCVKRIENAKKDISEAKSAARKFYLIIKNLNYSLKHYMTSMFEIPELRERRLYAISMHRIEEEKVRKAYDVLKIVQSRFTEVDNFATYLQHTDECNAERNIIAFNGFIKSNKLWYIMYTLNDKYCENGYIRSCFEIEYSMIADMLAKTYARKMRKMKNLAQKGSPVPRRKIVYDDDDYMFSELFDIYLLSRVTIRMGLENWFPLVEREWKI